MARILVIEDEESVLSLVTRILVSAGHEVDGARDGQEGMRLFEESAPDVVLTDINMPGMDGMEVIKAMRSARAEVPIVAISGGGMMPKELLLGSASLLGAVAVVAKPFEIADLLDAVDRALGLDRDGLEDG